MAAHVGFSIYLSMQMHFYTNKSYMQSIASDGLQRDEHVNMRDKHVNMRDERVKPPRRSGAQGLGSVRRAWATRECLRVCSTTVPSEPLKFASVSREG